MNGRLLLSISATGLLAALGAVGCVGSRGSARGGSSADDERAGSIHRRAAKNEKVTEYDLNRDTKPDVWDYTVPPEAPPSKPGEARPPERLVRKELDVNWDGRIDLAYDYDDKERVAKASFDLDFDGRVDQVNLYEKGVLIRKERDLDYNGKPDEWVFFERGKVVRKERDVNGDGRADYWEYWENDQVDRIGEDLDGDGKVDRWTKNTRDAS